MVMFKIMREENESKPSQKRGDPAAKAWAAERAAQFGDAVQWHRKKLELTAVDLANRTKEIGYPITRATIAKIENNQRNSKVDLAEVVVLAAALRISPSDLMFPGYPDRKLKVTPRVTMKAGSAHEWVNGDDSYLAEYDAALNPHTPVIERSTKLRKALREYNLFCDAVEESLEYPLFDKQTHEKAREYRLRAKFLGAVVLRYGGEVKLPIWYDDLEEPDAGTAPEGE